VELPIVKWGFQAADLRKHWDWPAQQAMVDNILERTDGRFQITIYDMYELGLDPSQWSNALSEGVIEISVVSPSQHAATLPHLGVHTLPFLHVWPDEFYQTGYELMPIMEREFRKVGAITPIEFFIIDPAVLWTIEAYDDVSDINKARIRVWDEMGGYGVAAMNGDPILMAFSEVYVSLQRGVVDGLITGPGGCIMGSFWDFCKHGYLIGFPGNIYYLAYNNEAFNSLPYEYQVILLEEAAKMADQQEAVAWPSLKDALAEIEANGIEIHEVSADSIGIVGDKLKPRWQEWADRVGPVGQELLDEALNIMGK